MKIRLAVLLALPMLLAALPGADAPSTQPASTEPSTTAAATMPAGGYFTEDQLVQAFRAHDFATVLRETMRIQRAPVVAARYKLFDLMVLRAESDLQTKNVPAAIEGFTQAAVLTPDEDRKSVMLATVLLLREQRGLKYLSHTTDEHGTPIPTATAPHKFAQIDVVDLAQRTAALHALCSDKVAAAAQLTNQHYPTIAALKPLIAAVQQVSIVERAADGQQMETKKLQLKTGEAAGLVISGALQAMTKRANQYQVDADSLINPQSYYGNYNNNPRGRSSPQNPSLQPTIPRGLTSQEANDLLAMIQTAKQVPTVTRQLIGELNLDSKYFDSINGAAQTLAKLAQALLDKEPVHDPANR